MKKPCSATDPLWYKDAIIYELHVRAFSDSNADGIGDFQGLISKLDYLQDLGVTCLWLLPFFPSPLRDDGYDISNYTNVNPAYGTIEDFQAFLAEAHARNLQVMIELVINHTSDQHPWFQRARLAPKGSPERNFYVWSDTNELYKDARIIFTDTEKSNWTWDDIAQQYYWHRFFSHQPDLNFDNPAVMEEILKAMRFWLDMGVDGLRLDAIPYIVERDGTSCENLPETHAKIKQIRAVIDAEYENRLVLAEANMWPADVRPYFGDGDECHMAFHFPLMPRIYMALRQEDRLPITDIMAQTPPIPESCQWGLFLRNHDELTLEMVTNDERDYMNLAYAADTRMRINVGIRRRLAPLVDNNRRRIELLNSLLLSFPGTPIMYYGDEIGMGDNIYLGDRNGVRTPMQWNSDRNAGFSKAVPAKLYFPVIMDPVWGYQAINVEAQQSDASSLLHWTRNMIALRKIFQVFGRGTLDFLQPENRKVLAYIREYKDQAGNENNDYANTGDGEADAPSEIVLCVANLSRFAQPVALDLTKYAGRQPVEMLGYVPFPAIDKTPYALTLAPYSFFWLELQPAARPDAQAVPASFAEQMSSRPESAPLAITNLSSRPESSPLAITNLSSRPESSQSEDVAERPAAPVIPPTIASLLNESSLNRLNPLLPAYLAKQRWFGGKSRTIHSTRIASTIPIDDTSLIAVIELTYNDATTDLYQLPLAIASEEQATTLAAASPKSIIASLDHATILFDASASPTFRAALLSKIVNPTESNTDLVAAHSSALDPKRLADVPSRLGSAEQSNTSILYDDLAILKLFRRLSPGENPDVEITRFLTEVAHFDHIPAYLGDLHLAADNTTLAFLQAFAPNHGDGWAWTLNELSRFYESVATCPPPIPVSSPLSPTDFSSRSESSPLAATNLSSRPESSPPAATNLSSRPEPSPLATTNLSSRPELSPLTATSLSSRPESSPLTATNLSSRPESSPPATTNLSSRPESSPPATTNLSSRSESSPLATTNLSSRPESSQSEDVAERPAAPSPDILQHASGYLTAAELLGRRTAELHLALATPTDDPAFTAEPTTAEDLANDRQRIEQQITSALDALQRSLETLPSDVKPLAQTLLSQKDSLLARIQSLNDDAKSFGQRIRIHGDYHLGQLLRIQSNTQPDFLIIDFEGEPARSLEDRRRKQSPLRDVAGMLRSFSYAARSALQAAPQRTPANAANLEAWATAWENAASNAFLRGYRSTIASNSALLPSPSAQDSAQDLFALLLEKASYELLYELNNRPTWVIIPLTALLAIAHNGA